MAKRLSLDFETYSSVKLLDLGAYKYAEGEDTEVLIVAVQDLDTPDVLTWDIRQPPNEALSLLERAITEGWEIHAFNVQFEWVILKYVCTRQFGWPVPNIENMRCTAAVCRSAGLPPSLARAAEFLKLPVQKDKVGRPLINTFSVPNKKHGRIHWDTEGSFTLAGERTTYADAFQMFVDYCAQDVRTEVAVAEKMKFYTLKGFPLEWFILDMKINDRGVPVDLEALQAAYDLYREKEELLTRRFREITNLNPSQRDRCFEWFQSKGYTQPKLNKECRAIAMQHDTLSEDAVEALEIKSSLGYAAVKKIPSMLKMAMNDGRIRGSFLWCGAQKTWRWTSKTPQWQNMKKPPKWLRPMVEDAYQTIRRREVPIDIFEFVYGPAYEVTASLSRYFVRFPDNDIFDLDFASVEARILPQIIGAKRIMDKIRTGDDIYVSTGQSLGAALQKVFKVDFDIDRDTAKTVVLATQFQGGWKAVFTATGSKWPRPWCELAVKIVREENPELPRAWRAFQEAFISAFDTPHKWVPATDYVSFAYVTKGAFPRMLMRLPSGRCITYPHAERAPITMVRVNDGVSKKWVGVRGHIDDEAELYSKLTQPWSKEKITLENWFHTYELSFYGHVKDNLYGRVHTYGGDLLQSATQGTGADLLANGAICAEKKGFQPFFLVHDQALAVADGRKEEFERAMCSVPDWFSGFPLEADAEIARSYSKT